MRGRHLPELFDARNVACSWLRLHVARAVSADVCDAHVTEVFSVIFFVTTANSKQFAIEINFRESSSCCCARRISWDVQQVSRHMPLRLQCHRHRQRLTKLFLNVLRYVSLPKDASGHGEIPETY